MGAIVLAAVFSSSVQEPGAEPGRFSSLLHPGALPPLPPAPRTLPSDLGRYCLQLGEPGTLPSLFELSKGTRKACRTCWAISGYKLAMQREGGVDILGDCNYSLPSQGCHRGLRKRVTSQAGLLVRKQ